MFLTDEDVNNWRGRRLHVCRSISDIEKIIDNLGVEENSKILPPNHPEQVPEVSDAMKKELKNQARVLLRMILILNDEHVSSSQLQAF